MPGKVARPALSNGAEVAEELRRFLDGEPILKRGQWAEPKRAWQWCRRYPQVASLSAMLVVALVAGTAIATLLAVEPTEVPHSIAKDAIEPRKTFS